MPSFQTCSFHLGLQLLGSRFSIRMTLDGPRLSLASSLGVGDAGIHFPIFRHQRSSTLLLILEFLCFRNHFCIGLVVTVSWENPIRRSPTPRLGSRSAPGSELVPASTDPLKPATNSFPRRPPRKSALPWLFSNRCSRPTFWPTLRQLAAQNLVPPNKHKNFS